MGLWAFLIGLLVVVGIASGGYPAFYLSSFQPVTIFSDTQKMGSKTLFMESFLTLQLMLACITMISSITLTLNAMDQAERDWGYYQEHLLVVKLEDGNQFDVLRDEAMQLPDVLGVAGTRYHLEGGGEVLSKVEIEGETLETVRFDTGPNYLETMGFRLTEGGFSDYQTGGDAVVVNERFVQRKNGSDPIGKTLRLDGKTYTVTGVVENFHYDSFFEDIEPVLFCLTDASNYRFLVMRLKAGTDEETAVFMKEAWNRIAPDTPFEYFYQDTVFDRFYQTNRNLVNIFTFIAGIALLISCMGLFGLVSQNIAGRMKEICIHKILGASALYVTGLISRRFLMLLVIAVLIATPASYFMLNILLEAIYTYHMGLGFTPFLISYALVFATAALTVLTQFRTLAAANPAEALRESN